MLGFNNCLKIADVPFPLPFAQLLGLLLATCMSLRPLFLGLQALLFYLTADFTAVAFRHLAEVSFSAFIPVYVINFTGSPIAGPILHLKLTCIRVSSKGQRSYKMLCIYA